MKRIAEPKPLRAGSRASFRSFHTSIDDIHSLKVWGYFLFEAHKLGTLALAIGLH